MKKGRLVILIGIDGSGKSTLLSYLEKKGYFVSHWKKLSGLPLSKPLNFDNPGELVQNLKGKERLDFLWEDINSEWKNLIKPTLEAGENVVSDGFFIRFVAKEKIYKKLVIDDLLRRSPLEGKEFVVMIDTPPAVALKRKAKMKISPYEFFNRPEDFLEFQSRQRKVLLDCLKGFPHFLVDGTIAPKKLGDLVFKKLKKRQIVRCG